MRRPVGGDDEARGPRQGANLSIPNLITLGRILLVPVVVWAITAGEMRVAFVLFLAAGISDAVDGFLAKRFGMATELGAYLDPLADKAMLGWWTGRWRLNRFSSPSSTRLRRLRSLV